MDPFVVSINCYFWKTQSMSTRMKIMIPGQHLLLEINLYCFSTSHPNPKFSH